MVGSKTFATWVLSVCLEDVLGPYYFSHFINFDRYNHANTYIHRPEQNSFVHNWNNIRYKDKFGKIEVLIQLSHTNSGHGMSLQ
jgi:hypothetical protein